MSNTLFTISYRRRTLKFGFAALAIYILMLLVTLKKINSLSGVPAFDLRPSGYNYQEAEALLQGLGQAGRQYYLFYQIPLDVAYPAMLVLTMTNAFLWCNSSITARGWMATGIGFSWLACAADYVENIGICTMLLTWPELSSNMVRLTSTASVFKAGATFVSVTLLLALVVRIVFYKRRLL